MRRAVFLDRDGTLVVEVGYLSDPDALELLPGVPAALRALLGYFVYGATLGSIVGAVQPEDRYASHTL